MKVPEWPPMKERKGFKYTLNVVNGVHQIHKQEVSKGLIYLHPFPPPSPKFRDVCMYNKGIRTAGGSPHS